MGRMVKCAFTGKIADSSCLYKVGRQWFEDKDTYIRYLKSKDIIKIFLNFLQRIKTLLFQKAQKIKL